MYNVPFERNLQKYYKKELQIREESNGFDRNGFETKFLKSL